MPRNGPFRSAWICSNASFAKKASWSVHVACTRQVRRWLPAAVVVSGGWKPPATGNNKTDRPLGWMAGRAAVCPC